MDIKTILVHLESELQAPHLLDAAVRLANQYSAHLIGTYVNQSLDPYVARSGEAVTSEELSKILLKDEYERAKHLEQVFNQSVKNQNFVAEWRFDKSLNYSVITGLLDQARTADLLLVSPIPRSDKKAQKYNQLGSTITRNPRPTLVVPQQYHNKSLGEYIFIAWDGSSRASRAVFDALPILTSAKSVWVHRVKSNDEAKRHDNETTRQLADSLARHGVQLEMSESVGSSRKVGSEILNCAQDRGADCIVMGANGHTRLHGFLLGNTTEFVLENSTVPLLMSR
ncbi:MAG: universal stress protein [Gammaproteobacteria bacterium]|nr:universal stress protein [Gammaproteobacteria bacterium]